MIEEEAIQRARGGDEQAWRVLLDNHKGLLIFHASREYDESPLDFEEAMSIAYEVFVKCVYSYNPENKAGLSFGKWVGTNIWYAMDDEREKARHRHFKIPVRTAKVLRAIANDDCTRAVTENERKLAEEFQKVIVYEGDCADEEGNSLFARIGVEHEFPMEDRHLIRDMVDSIPNDSERKIMQLYLLDFTFAEIGRIVGLSRERIRQVHDKSVLYFRRRLGLDD